MPSTELEFVRLDGRRREALFQQIYESIRQSILAGKLKPGVRLPSSRDLTQQWGVSRTTVVAAIDRLVAEGYLHSVRGSGTFVSDEMSEECLCASVPWTPPGANESQDNPAESRNVLRTSEVSDFGAELMSIDKVNADTAAPEAFCPGEPATDAFPMDVWSKIVRGVWKRVRPVDLTYGEPAGQLPLRRSIASYLQRHRGVRCEPRQVMIVGGTQQGVDLVSRLLVSPGDRVLFENPGYVSARDAIEKAAGRIVCMPVDEHGACVSAGTALTPQAKLAYVTPSHQYPIGATMPIERRLELLAWASDSKAWILEDDYDSEYRYGQQPIPAMQGLDASGRVIYVGSFSKVVFPALGLGYVIVPPQLVEVFENALRLASRPGSQIDQLVLSEFIREGHFGRHLRRMRRIHAQRRLAFVEGVRSLLSDRLTIIGSQAGLHCAALLKSKKSDVRIVRELGQAGITARALSEYYHPSTPTKDRLKGLVFGFACVAPAQIKKGLAKVAEVVC
ncbi:MAG TPA: PLP-dependent aminotransferase family protein [Planctomycetaceae bacterium]|nr:PLP-dependent aminotransferase family protein [Planctomycetaceae bacterium]